MPGDFTHEHKTCAPEGFTSAARTARAGETFLSLRVQQANPISLVNRKDIIGHILSFRDGNVFSHTCLSTGGGGGGS